MTKKKEKAEFEKSVLTAKEALGLLSTHKGNVRMRVHTFTFAGTILMGCDLDLRTIKEIFKTLKEKQISLSGDNMRGMGHGVAFFQDGKGWTFLETDDAKIDKIFELRGV